MGFVRQYSKAPRHVESCSCRLLPYPIPYVVLYYVVCCFTALYHTETYNAQNMIPTVRLQHSTHLASTHAQKVTNLQHRLKLSSMQTFTKPTLIFNPEGLQDIIPQPYAHVNSNPKPQRVLAGHEFGASISCCYYYYYYYHYY